MLLLCICQLLHGIKEIRGLTTRVILSATSKITAVLELLSYSMHA